MASGRPYEAEVWPFARFSAPLLGVSDAVAKSLAASVSNEPLRQLRQPSLGKQCLGNKRAPVPVCMGHGALRWLVRLVRNWLYGVHTRTGGLSGNKWDAVPAA
jgi:hypothetical protein